MESGSAQQRSVNGEWDERCVAGADAGRLPADPAPHPRRMRYSDPRRRGRDARRGRASARARPTARSLSAIDRLARVLDAARRAAGRPRGDVRVEQPAPLRAVLRDPLHRRGAAHAQHPPVRGAAHLHRQPRRGPGDLRRRLARAAARAARRRASRASSHYVVMGDGRPRQPAERAALRGAARGGGSGRVRLPRAGRAPGRGALLHERHDRQPQGRALLAPLDQPALLRHADDATPSACRAPTACWRSCRCSTPTPGACRTARRSPAPT